ncbi:unnamed protein product [Candidula unifasciata]|uniref:Glycosyltransferase family 92 protein n=1 Tax=Candidula unifasciata TaxID=100452 RepID=A0A8S3ZM59_9EUPU|nr:unnamed protein product [Candidula unifasciata]
MARLFVHASTLRITLLLLSAVTLVYLIFYLVWDDSVSCEHPRSHAGHEHSVKSWQEVELSQGDFMDQHHVPAGMGIWLKDRNIQIISAIHDLHHPKQSEIRIVLPSFLQHSSQREFVCCFHLSAKSDKYIEVPAGLDFIDLRFIVDIQNAAFDCVLKHSETAGDHRIKFVSFAPRTCQEDLSLPLTVVYPVRRSWEFAVCTKVAYARLEPVRLVEWFEYMRLIGASKIVTFHNNLHSDSRRVFDFYAATGFLELIEYRPQTQKSRILYKEKNSQTNGARQEKTLVVRDCQYRLGGYDFVITIDFDELPVPARPYRTLNSIIQNLLRNNSKAAAFRMDPILLPPEWQKPAQDLYHWQFSMGTYIAPHCVKWAYLPAHTWLATTHDVTPKEGYSNYVIPHDVLYFLHFRSCKADWQGVHCKNLTHTFHNEVMLKRFHGDVVRNLRKLPLENLIPDKEYVQLVRAGVKPGPNTDHLDDDPFVGLLLTDQ